MTPSEKLMRRLRSELGMQVPIGTKIRRTYAGRNMLAAGAWRWFLWGENFTGHFGGPDTVSVTLKARRLVLGLDGTITAE